jgi:MoaA/NifB/PqqE/SkfB family radical SAM enzyme
VQIQEASTPYRRFPLRYSALQIVLDSEQTRAAFATAASLGEVAAVFDASGAKSAASLVRALIDCENGDIYDAGQKLFSCLSAPDMWFIPNIIDSDFCITETSRMNLTKSFDIDECIAFIEGFSGPQSIPAIIVAFALAACRYCCIRGDHQWAAEMVKHLLLTSRESIYLRALESALGRLTAGEPVPVHLRKFVGEDDDGYLKHRFCPLPFGRAEIHQHGEVVVCCSHWVPTVIGNVLEQPLIDVVNSATAKAIRRSVVDGSFKYCSHADCEFLINDKLPYKRDYAGRGYDDDYIHLDEAVLDKAFAEQAFEVPGPSHITYCFDRSCNLSCPSCRTEIEMVTGPYRDRLYDITERTIALAMKTAKRIMVNPSGEVFVSRPSRRLLEQLARPDYDHVKVDIITNGTVCDRTEWDKFSHLYGRLGIIRVSLDAARKETFERLRRGANYETVVSNLKNLQQMMRERLAENFFVSFTYQRDNFREMEEFVEFAGNFNVSSVLFERLQNVGAYSPEEYYERAVHLVHHPLYGEFLQIARRLKPHPKVYMDFDPGPITEWARPN